MATYLYGKENSLAKNVHAKTPWHAMAKTWSAKFSTFQNIQTQPGEVWQLTSFLCTTFDTKKMATSFSAICSERPISPLSGRRSHLNKHHTSALSAETMVRSLANSQAAILGSTRGQWEPKTRAGWARKTDILPKRPYLYQNYGILEYTFNILTYKKNNETSS